MREEDRDSGRVIVLGANPSDTSSLEALLERDFLVESRATLDTFESLIEQGRPDLVVWDSDGSVARSAEVAKILKNQSDDRPLPLLLIARDLPEGLLATLEFHGIPVDWLGKPVEPVILRLRVANLIRMKRQVDQLRASQAKALEKLRILESQVQMVIHDLRSPVVSIRGFINRLRRLLASQAPDPRTADTLDCLDKTGRSIEAFLDETTDVLISGSNGRHWGPVQLDRVIDEVVELHRDELDKRAIDVRLNTSAGPCSIIGDRQRIRQVFDNLLSNAIRHMRRKRDPCVTISVHHDDHRVIAGVSDNGAGIPPQYRDKIFDRFFRIPGSESESGSGLGLSIVRRIVEDHNGRIRAESETGKGTSFILSFPRPLRNGLRRPSLRARRELQFAGTESSPRLSGDPVERALPPPGGLLPDCPQEATLTTSDRAPDQPCSPDGGRHQWRQSS